MDVMAIASIGMQADLARMESISHNTANALTPGYKRQVSVSSGFSVELSAAGSALKLHAQSPLDRLPSVAIDPAAGALRPTGLATDVAIEGPGFFEVNTPDGIAYTRQGNLRADSQGKLVTGNNFTIGGAGGALRVTNAPFSVSPAGDITQDGRVIGRLKVVHFASPQNMIPRGAGLYVPGTAQQQENQPAAALRIGFLEGSNVNTPHEMVRLTETVRHFESLQKIVQGYDESLEKTIRKLGEF